ncbi:MAG: hypothetical protein U5M23_00845 [Marinagarivorans sp.]|nr:hypothetical protein [Marinagarivorans sp.]
MSTTNFAKLVVAQGMVGGAMSVLQGGKFGHGFVSAGFSKLTTPLVLDMGNTFAEGFASAMVGGTVSEMTGGKFANGATTAAFLYAFNALTSSVAQKGDPDNGGYSPAAGGYLDEGGNLRSLSVNEHGGLQDADGNFYNFDPWAGTVSRLESGALSTSAPELVFIGAGRATVSLGYSLLGLAASVGPKTYTNFAINSLARDTLKVASLGFLYRMPKFNPAFYWAKNGGDYAMAVSRLGRSNIGYDSVFAGMGAIGAADTVPRN